MIEPTFSAKQAKDIRAGDKIYANSGKHTTILEVEPINDLYVNLTYLDQFGSKVGTPYRVNQVIYIATGESHEYATTSPNIAS